MSAIVSASLVVRVWCYVIFVIYCFFCAQSLYRRWPRVCENFSPWASIRSLVEGLRRAGDVDSDVIAREVHRLTVLRRLDGLRMASRWFARLAAATIILQCLPGADLFVSESPVAVFVGLLRSLVLILAMLVSVFPNVLTVTRAHAVLCCFMAGQIALLRTLEGTPDLVYALPFLTVLRLVVSILMSSITIRLVGNIGYSIASCVVFLPIASDSKVTTVHLVVEGARNIILREISTTIAIFIISSVIDAMITSESRATAMSKASKHGEHMANSLLTALCDAVVFLDDSLRICAPAPKLANIILLQPCSHADLVGSNFLNMVDEADRRQFEGLGGEIGLVSAGDRMERDPARLMHVQLVDANGMRVKAELLIATCCSSDDRSKHIVGIRETDCEAVSCLDSFLHRRSSLPPSAPSLVAYDSDYSCSSDSTISQDSEHSFVQDSDSNPFSVRMRIDSGSARYTVMTCVPLVGCSTGVSFVGHRLLDLLGSHDGARLRRSIEDLGHAVLYGTTGPPVERLEMGCLTLASSADRLAGIRYQATCVVEVSLTADSSDGDGEDAEFVVHVFFHDLCRLVRQSPGPQQGTASSSAPLCEALAAPLSTTPIAPDTASPIVRAAYVEETCLPAFAHL